LVPPGNYTLREKIHGGVPRRVELDETVDLRKCGVEKFRAIRKDQTEGEFQGRRAAPVLDQDRLFLERYGLPWEVIVDGCTWVLLHDFPLPNGYSHSRVVVAIRMESGYPMAALDMMYVYPAVSRADGKQIAQVNCWQPLDGKQFQRWSRHRTPANQWVVGQDSLETHIYLIEEYFHAELRR
jgi:Prokaryotic E2 family E